jgi:hypothetical protein
MAEFTEFLTANAMVAFPFADDAPGLDAGPVPRDALIDAHMSCSLAPATLYLRGISRDDLHYRFHVGTAGGVVAVGGIPNGVLPRDRQVVRFENLAEVVAFRGALVLGPGAAGWLATLSIQHASQDYGLSMPFSPSACEFRAPRVERVWFRPHGAPPGDPGVLMPGMVKLLAGTNMRVALEADDSAAMPEGLALSAMAGEGDGTHNPCAGPAALDYVATAGKVAPSETGELTLAPGACYSATPDFNHNTVVLVNECAPCCGCGDYAEHAEELERRAAILRDLEARFKSAVAEHNLLADALRKATRTQCCMAMGAGQCGRDASVVTATAFRHKNAEGGAIVLDDRMVRVDITIDNSRDAAPKPEDPDIAGGPQPCVRWINVNLGAGTLGQFQWAGVSPEAIPYPSPDARPFKGYGAGVASLTPGGVRIWYRAGRKSILKCVATLRLNSGGPGAARILVNYADNRVGSMVASWS